MAPITPDTDASTPPTGTPMPVQIPLSAQEPARPSAVGIALKQAREAKSQSIEQVAARLRIRANFLKALEEGDSQALPGHVYALGFVRSYAEYLKLDPIETVQGYKREVDDHAHHAELTFPAASVPRQSSGIPAMVVLGALLLAGLAGWQITQTKTVLIADGISTPPGLSNAGLTVIAGTSDNAASSAPAPIGPAPHIATALLDIARASTSKTPGQDSNPLAPADPIPWPAYVLPSDLVAALNERAAANKAPPTPQRRPQPPAAEVSDRDEAAEVVAAPVRQREPEDPIPSAGNAPKPAAKVASQSVPAKIPSPRSDTGTTRVASLDPSRLPPIPPTMPATLGATNGGNAYGQANSDARIVIAAKTDIWIQIRDRNQNDLFTRMLRAGDSYRVPNRPDLLLLTGNAGGLKLTVDGNTIASLGSDGAVRRDIALNADDLLARATPQ